MALNLVVPGDVIIPRPSWNTYAPQARLAGKQAVGVDIPAECGGVPEPAQLRRTIAAMRERGRDPRIVVLTLPDNPTGTLASAELIQEICTIAQDEDLLIVSDEIYRDVIHDPRLPMLSPAEVAPDRTVVTVGLSKSLAIGGWRIGAARFPATEWGERLRQGVVSVASEVWSTLAGPMQQVATYAFNEPPELRAWIATANRLHGTVAREMHRIVVAAGATCRPPTGAFYVYPDLEPLRARLAYRHITDSASLSQHLLDEFGIIVLAGHHLGDDPQALRFKAATSMLYGDTRMEQQAALDATDPLALPHIQKALATVEESLLKLTS
jgi:aspartate aminotransferase